MFGNLTSLQRVHSDLYDALYTPVLTPVALADAFKHVANNRQV